MPRGIQPTENINDVSGKHGVHGLSPARRLSETHEPAEQGCVCAYACLTQPLARSKSTSRAAMRQLRNAKQRLPRWWRTLKKAPMPPASATTTLRTRPSMSRGYHSFRMSGNTNTALAPSPTAPFQAMGCCHGFHSPIGSHLYSLQVSNPYYSVTSRYRFGHFVHNKKQHIAPIMTRRVAAVHKRHLVHTLSDHRVLLSTFTQQNVWTLQIRFSPPPPPIFWPGTAVLFC